MRELTTEYRHTPVMAQQAVDGLGLKSGSIVLDCTLGGGGHSMLIAQSISDGGTLIGIDEDPMAIEAASQRIFTEFPDLDFRPMQGNFSNLDQILCKAQVPGVDAVLMDLGLSSPQIDFPERGFSYMQDAPLDMRRDPSNRNSLTAAEVIANSNTTDLTRIFRNYGEEKWASKIAAAIVMQRKKAPIKTTMQLVDVIKSAIPVSAQRSGGHPAKRVFQALRIEVNHELEDLKIAVEAAVRWLFPQGRIAVISYHSLEDRIVKESFTNFAQGCVCPLDLPVCACGKKPKLEILTKKPMVPAKDEMQDNPRSRSAKLRIAKKI